MRFSGIILSILSILTIANYCNAQSRFGNELEGNYAENNTVEFEKLLEKAREFAGLNQADSMVYYLEKARLSALIEGDSSSLYELTQQLAHVYRSSNGNQTSGSFQFTGKPDFFVTPLVLLVIVLIGFLVLISVMFISYRQLREKNKKLLKKLRKKNKELTGATLKLLKQNMDIEHVSYKLRQLRSEQVSADHLERIAGNLTNIPQSKDQLWESFKFNFEETNEEFYINLQGKHPNISQQDLKVCTLLRMNFSSKEVASILGISYDGVRKARYRLRKKLELTQETSLEKYLTSI